jgi:predicted RNA-binding Zn-ribbon protein involved in translation (DUF1610 family)
MANNILDFLIDPTRIPVQERVYFRPEEILKNKTYEQAKAEACLAYKDQKHNSDFYPKRNRTQTQMEASIMDRKSLIASLDVLSKNFSNPSDPFAHDLQIMAVALSKMSDEELQPRLAAEAPDLEWTLVEAAKTFKCPECGTNVLQQTGYCVKCKKKVKQAEDVEATGPIAPGQVGEKPFGRGLHSPGGWTSPAEGKGKALPKAEVEKRLKQVVEQFIPAPPKGLLEKLVGIVPALARTAESKEEEDDLDDEEKTAMVSDFWTKEASDLVAGFLVSELGVVAKDDDVKDEPAPAPAPKEEKKEEAPAPAPKKAPEEEKDVKAGKEKGPGIPDGTGPMSGTPECPKTEKKEEEPKAASVEKPKEAAKPVEEEKKPEEETSKAAAPAKVVNTDILASINFAGIEMESGVMSMDDVGEMSETEKANLAKLF